MNIRKENAGYMRNKDFLNNAFDIIKTIEYPEWIETIYSNGKFIISGGYWNYYVKDLNENLLGEYWWNTIEEFNDTIKELQNANLHTTI